MSTARCRQAFLSITLAIVVSGNSTLADAIVRVRAMTATTIAEYFIEPSGVRVELEIGVADLAAFRNLLPDELYEKLGDGPRPLSGRLAEFFAQDLVIAPAGGSPIVGRLSRFELRQRVPRDEVTGEELPPTGDPDPVIFAELSYPFVQPPPGLILSGPTGSSRASIGFVAYHRGVAVNDFRYLGRDYELDLDWVDPWYSRFKTRNLRRAYEAAMSGFIYVEPYEVRKEIIVRPRDLQSWLDLGLEEAGVIPAEAQPELTRRIGEFLRQRQPVTINGREVEPELARINFLRRTLRNSTVVDPPEDLDLSSATLGVIFAYPTDGLPEQVTMEWDLFNERVDRVPVAAVDQAGPLPGYLTPDDPILVWQNFLKNPALPTLIVTEPPPGPIVRAVGLARWGLVAAVIGLLVLTLTRVRKGAGFGPRLVAVALMLVLLTAGAFWFGRDARMSEESEKELVSGLLHNVYRSFDYRDEERIYDTLARSVSGEMLTDIYLETRRGLEIQNQGGARAKVKNLELVELETEPGPNGGFTARALWNVSGSVGHWGHLHQRANRYRAGLGIEPVDGVWKLTSIELIEEERIENPSVGGGA